MKRFPQARYAPCQGTCPNGDCLPIGSNEHLRAVLEWFDLKRLTTQVGTALLDIFDKQFPHVDDLLKGMSGEKRLGEGSSTQKGTV